MMRHPFLSLAIAAAVACGAGNLPADPVISEFCASNASLLADEDGAYGDWIEIHNPGPDPVDLAGYALTDNEEQPKKWQFPAVSLDSGGYLVVFASGKDRPVAGAELHASFRLSSGGEYLALTKPDGSAASAFAPAFPPQYEDETYGIGTSSATIPVTFLEKGAAARWIVPAEDIGTAWRETAFDDAAWSAATTGLGFGFDGLTGDASDALLAAMRGFNASAYVRLPFTVDDPSVIIALNLRLKYEDGFIAYLNGEPVAADNEPENPQWNSSALASRSDSLAEEWEEVPINFAGLLQAGRNVLAVQMLNSSAGGSDLLFLPELRADTIDTAQPLVTGYMTAPTPGAPNSSAEVSGPGIFDVTENPDPPAADAGLKITARVLPHLKPVDTVRLRYRVMFEEPVSIPMTDDGSGGDATAADGEFTAIIPGGIAGPGEMLRWAVEAADTDGIITTSPRFRDPTGSPEYFGTIIADPSIQTKLPVLHRFVELPSRAENGSGTRCSVFYEGEFFDNTYIRIRGGTARSWPKKSYKLEFNDGHHFRFRKGVPRVDEVNLNATYTDKAYVRALLSSEMGQDSGTPSPATFHIRMHQNAEFFSVAYIIEQPDKDFLRRHGFDTEGQLYKANPGSTYDSVGSFEKKTHKEDRSKADLQEFITGLRLRDAADLERFVFDNVDIPAQINFLAVAAITQNIDATDKNHFVYRDTHGNGEWQMLPWDLDLTFGPNALNTDTMVYDADRNFAAASHVFIGATPHLLHTGKYNRLIEAVVATDRTREMLLRRVRTLADEYLATSWFRDRLDEVQALIGGDVELDRAEWGNRAHFPGRTYTLKEAMDRIKDEYLTPRYTYLTVDQALASSSGLVFVEGAGSPVSAMVPGDDSLGLAWTSAGFDDSGWLQGSGGVGYERGAGEGYRPLMGIDLLAEDIAPSLRIDTDGDGVNETNSVYLRYPFNVDDPNAVGFLKLGMKYDDGYIAYLNGVKVAEKNAPAEPGWNSEATRSHSDSEAEQFETVDISGFRNLLVAGRNVLAIHGLNQGIANSDMILVPRLADEGAANSDAVGIPPAQAADVTLQFGRIGASGTPDGHFVEIVNPGATSVDLSNWQLRGAAQHVFAAGTVLPARDRLFLAASVRAFRGRTTAPTGGEANFVQGNFAGALSQGGSLEIRDGADRLVAATTISLEGGTFAAWVAGFFPPESADAAPDADPDGDGATNFLEYALAGSPNHFDAPAASLTAALADENGSRFLTLSFVRPANALDVGYGYEQSASLAGDDWTPAAAATETTAPVPGAPGLERVSVRIPVSEASLPALFLRLRVSGN